MSGQRLQYFPVSFFASVMGLSGLTLAWEKMESLRGGGATLSTLLLLFTSVVFVLLLLFYAAKFTSHRAAVLTELRHPIRLSFFPTISIAMVLLSIGYLHHAPALSHALWLAGSAAHLLFTLYVMNSWINHEHFQIQHMNPAWFIPVVGNILVPIAGVAHGYQEISWFFFSIGLLFWLLLFTIILYRVIFHQPLPQKLLPTLFILIAPPAVGFVSYVKLTGGVDVFARILFYSALFVTLLLFTQIQRFTRLKFFLSWWAYSFPLAAITIATLVMYQALKQPFLYGLGWVLLVVLSVVLLILLVRTAQAIMRGEICVPEE